jgi:starch synthase (maltosyl-transferring)
MKRRKGGDEAAAMHVEEGRRRVVIEGVKPEIDGGRFPIKRTVGESVVVEADAFTDGHDLIAVVLQHRREDEPSWTEVPMEALVNDRWRAEFQVTELGRCRYRLMGWLDPFASWLRDLRKRIEALQDVSVDLLIGAQLVEEAAEHAASEDADRLRAFAQALRDPTGATPRLETALDPDLERLMALYADRTFATVYDHDLTVVVDPERARFSAWYEMFPRSASPEPDRHATFADAEARLPYIAGMGFDVVYLPPVHPIGRSYRKGMNNALAARRDEVGSPWAIGGKEGGHKAVHPDLGTLEDFRRFVEKARDYGMDVALDIAYQVSPDHPYVAEHPEWFRRRPDGTIQYAENPPKKYQDIYPFDFQTESWKEMWEELKSIVLFWIGQGVRIFRVDNPHTKVLPFWGWLIEGVKRDYPDVIFLSEAFTRPKVMYYLAKLGFTQSYTYFAWRNTKWELTEYFTELTKTDVREFFRPNLWPNTPDILTEYLQTGGRPASMIRFILAATLGASYGIYGPAFELMDVRPREPGGEEYLDSEKYQLRNWDLDQPDSLHDLIARVNAIRKENVALQSDWSLRFHGVDNEMLICYSKSAPDKSNVILTVVNLDPRHTQAGWVDLDTRELGLDADEDYQAHDLLSNARYLWRGARNFVQLDPYSQPAHLFAIRRRARTEQDFDYYT